MEWLIPGPVLHAVCESHIAIQLPNDAPTPCQRRPMVFFPWGSNQSIGSFRNVGPGCLGLIPGYPGKNQIPTIHFVAGEGLTNPDFFDTPGRGLKSPVRVNKGGVEGPYKTQNHLVPMVEGPANGPDQESSLAKGVRRTAPGDGLRRRIGPEPGHESVAGSRARARVPLAVTKS